MNEQIEVPVRAEIPLSKYLARIPKALFLKGRSHCDRKGISLNTLITIALRDYLDAGDIDVPTQPKLSQVFRDELAGLEARLLEALKPPVYTIVNSIEPGESYSEGRLRQLLETQRLHKGGFISDSVLGQGEVPAILERGEAHPSVLSRQQALRQTEKADRLALGIEQPLNWDQPAPQQRLWPDNPAVNGLAPEPLKGQVWVVTGDFDTMTTSRVREVLQQAGAIVATTVNKKTSAVLAGYSPESEKLDAAEAQMLPVWGELQFLHMAKFIGADVRIPE